MLSWEPPESIVAIGPRFPPIYVLLAAFLVADISYCLAMPELPEVAFMEAPCLSSCVSGDVISSWPTCRLKISDVQSPKNKAIFHAQSLRPVVAIDKKLARNNQSGTSKSQQKISCPGTMATRLKLTYSPRVKKTGGKRSQDTRYVLHRTRSNHQVRS